MKIKTINGILSSTLVLLLMVTASGSAASAGAEHTYSYGTYMNNQEPADDAQSTTGPEPPPGLTRGVLSRELDYQVVIPGVPAYIWHRGCGPTAAGMVIGYWDSNGFGDLVNGSADTQTADVNNMISSPGNYSDYCLPMDNYPNLLPDKSQPPFGDEHPDDCAADFMKTSQSYYGNYYGWSWYSHVDDAFQGYVSLVAPQYEVTAYNIPWGRFTWDSFRQEIEANHPVVLLVDTDANGVTDHFVTAIGYGEANGIPMYACRNTWDADYSDDWYEFAPLSNGQPWGIYGVTIFRLNMNTVDLTINIVGSGTTSPEPGIHSYPPDTVVELSAAPDEGWDFSHWSGDAAGTSSAVTVTMDMNKDVTANFTLPGITLIGAIEQNLAAYEGQEVTVSGQYRGWETGHGSPPVTKSDWVIQDETGSTYVSGKLPWLRYPDDVGKEVKIQGVVRIKDGQPYIETWNVTTTARKLKYGTCLPGTSISARSDTWFFDEVARLSGGLVEMEYCYGEPYDCLDLHNAVSRGEIDCAFIDLTYVPGWVPLSEGFHLNYLTYKPDALGTAANELYDTFTSLQEEWEANRNVKVLYFLPGDTTALCTTNPVSGLDGFKGLKIAVFGRRQVDYLKALGASPVSIPLSDTYQAIERGVIDGAYLPFHSMWLYRLFEVAPYLTETWAGPHGVSATVINKDVWDSLPDTLKSLMENLSGDALNHYLELTMEANREAVEDMVTASMNFYLWPESEREKAQSMAQFLADHWTANMEANGLPGTEFLASLQALLAIYEPQSTYQSGFEIWDSLYGEQGYAETGEEITGLLPPIELPDKGHPKLDSQLYQLTLAETRGEAPSFSQQRNIRMLEQGVRVIIECEPGQLDAAGEAAIALGATFETSYHDYLQVVMPVSKLITMADDSNVRFVRLPWPMLPATITSEGVGLINATAWQSASFTGAGVKVAILDGGFAGYTALLGSELPPSVTAQSFCGDITGGGESHGTACAEIVYDIAPGAQFYLANFNTVAELGNAVDYLISQGVNLISASWGFPTAGAGDGTGPVCEIVDEARAAGILWVNAIGNQAERHWQGNFVNTNSNQYHEFVPGVDETNNISAQAGDVITVLLRWNDPWGASDNDYDLLLFDKYLNLVALSSDIQDGNDYPTEGLQYTATYSGVYNIAIGTLVSPQVANFHLYTFYQDLQYQVASKSFAIPSDSPNAMTVGAVPWSSPTTLESFSSRGPTDGGRTKPDLVAPDGVTTATYSPFYGTSASTPCAAGAAALVKEAYPSYTPAQIQSFLEGRAIGLGAAGKDNLYGSGRLHLGNLPTYTLTMHVSPTSSGTTTPTVGTHTYNAGTVVNLTATPGTGYGFSHWSGDATGTNPATTVTMNGNKDVTANFVRQYTLTMHVIPTDSGTTTPTVGSHTYDAGTVVNLTATPGTGYRFGQWSGDASGTNPATTVTMNSNKDVTANFALQYTLTIHVSPTDSGTTIPSAGTHYYDPGTVVNLTATPNMGYTFSQWSGDATGTSPSTTVTMNGNKDVTASFIRQYTLTINISPADSGTTNPSAGTIHYYDSGTVVDIIATPNTGWGFNHWSGNATGTDPSTSITMDSDKNATANFIVAYTLTIDVNPPESGTTNPLAGNHVYNTGTVVGLTATPGHGWSFSHWSGDASGTDPSTTVTMDADRETTANFTLELETLGVETAIGEGKDVDGVAVIPVSVARVVDPSTQDTVPGVPIADYAADLTFTTGFMEILGIRGGDPPFDTIPPGNITIDNVAGTASVSDDVSPSGTLPSIIIFRIVARLNDSCLVNGNLSVNVVEVSDPGGVIMNAQDQPMALTFQRGDVQANSTVNITDAMFGAQYVVSIRTAATIRMLNLASVRHDGTAGDKINITDCMFIAQKVVGIRDKYFELTGQ